MKQLLLAICCVLLWSGGVHASQQYVLSNGMNVYVKPDTRFPLVSIRVSVRTGSAQEQSRTYGIAHVLEHMVFKRTAKWQNGEAAKRIESIGGYFNAMTTFDSTTYIVDVPNDQWQVGLEVLEQMLFHATFDAKELEKEKQVVIEELKRGEDEPYNRIFKRIQGILLKGTPYQHPIIGTEKTINAVTVSDLQNYVKQNYQPQNMAITVVGNIDGAAVNAAITSRFSSYKNTSVLHVNDPIAIDALPYGQFVSVEYAAVNQAYIVLALPIAGEHTVAGVELRMLSAALASDLISPLLKKYQYDLKLVTDFSIVPYLLDRVGILCIVAELEQNNVEKYVSTLLEDLSTLSKQTFDTAMLQNIKNQFRDEIIERNATYSSIASYINEAQILRVNPILDAENTMAIIDALDVTDLQAVAKQWIRPERLALVGVLPPRSPRVQYTELLKKYWPAKQQKQENDDKKEVVAPIERLTIAEGRTLILIPDSNLPYTAINIAYKGGDALIASEKAGLTELTSALIVRGTKGMSIFDIERLRSSNSLDLSIAAGKTTFSIAATYPARNTIPVLQFLEKLVNEPTFPEEELDKVKKTQVAQIFAVEDRPFSLLFHKLYPLLFPNQLYGRDLLGTQETVQTIQRDDVVQYWKKQHAQEMVITVAGMFNKDEIIAFVKKLPAYNKKEAVALPQVVWGQQYTENVMLPERSQIHFLLSYPTTTIHSEDTPALVLLEAILNGQSGLLFRDLREEHALAYTVTSLNNQTSQYGVLSFYIGTSSSDQKLVVDRFQTVIQQLITTPLSSELIERGKRVIEGKYYRAVQAYSARAQLATASVLQGLPVSYNATLVQKVRALTASDIQRVAKKYLTNKTPYILTVKP